MPAEEETTTRTGRFFACWFSLTQALHPICYIYSGVNEFLTVHKSLFVFRNNRQPHVNTPPLICSNPCWFLFLNYLLSFRKSKLNQQERAEHLKLCKNIHNTAETISCVSRLLAMLIITSNDTVMVAWLITWPAIILLSNHHINTDIPFASRIVRCSLMELQHIKSSS